MIYRTDVVGSLLRPAYLKEARAEYEAGKLGDQAFKQIEDRAVAEAITFTYENAYPMLTPPGLPDGLVKILRQAFWDTVHDPQYVSEAKKTGFVDDDPVPGENVQSMVKQILNIPDEAKTRLRKLLGLN